MEREREREDGGGKGRDRDWRWSMRINYFSLDSDSLMDWNGVYVWVMGGGGRLNSVCAAGESYFEEKDQGRAHATALSRHDERLNLVNRGGPSIHKTA